MDLPCTTGTVLRHKPAYQSRMLYHFELQMAGVILFSAMIAGGIAIAYRRWRSSLSDREDGIEDAGEHPG